MDNNLGLTYFLVFELHFRFSGNNWFQGFRNNTGVIRFISCSQLIQYNHLGFFAVFSSFISFSRERIDYCPDIKRFPTYIA